LNEFVKLVSSTTSECNWDSIYVTYLRLIVLGQNNSREDECWSLNSQNLYDVSFRLGKMNAWQNMDKVTE